MTAAASASQPPLQFRAGKPKDWPRVAEITANTWDEGDYINEALWQRWTTNNEGYLAVALLDGALAGFCRVTPFGPAEWWLEGIRVDPALRRMGIARSLTAHLVEWFQRHGDGILRLATYSENEASKHLAMSFGFRHILSFAEVEAPAEAGDFRSFKRLGSQNLDLILSYLRRSPMHRINRFAEHYWTLYYLTRERLAGYQADASVDVLGWRQFDQLYGLAVVFCEPPPGREPGSSSTLYAGYLDALDDTTLQAMLRALRGLAAQRSLGSVTWKMPTGLGLERAVRETAFKTTWDDGELWLFELPLR